MNNFKHVALPSEASNAEMWGALRSAFPFREGYELQAWPMSGGIAVMHRETRQDILSVFPLNGRHDKSREPVGKAWRLEYYVRGADGLIGGCCDGEGNLHTL